MATNSEKTEVYIRVRPINEWERCMRCVNIVELSSNQNVVVKQSNENSTNFKFDNCFSQDCNQLTIYEVVVAPLIKDLMNGFNCSVIGYGQTGTGKTYTLIGPKHAYSTTSYDDVSEVGLIARAVTHLFQELVISGVKFNLKLSALQLCNENLTDLLHTTDQTTIRIYDDIIENVSIIYGLREVSIQSPSDVYKLLVKAEEKMKCTSTLMNIKSVYYHTIFTITMTMIEYDIKGEETLTISKLNFIDLTGNESFNDNSNINESLATLQHAINDLAESKSQIPYYKTKVTRLLQESLAGHTKTSIIATVSPTDRDVTETVKTLKFVKKWEKIVNKPEIMKKFTKNVARNQYSEVIDRLQKELGSNKKIKLRTPTNNSINIPSEYEEPLLEQVNERKGRMQALMDEIKKIEQTFNELSNVDNKVNANEVSKGGRKRKIKSKAEGNMKHRKVMCRICGKFRSANNIAAHETSHRKPKVKQQRKKRTVPIHICDICNSFTSSLKKEINTHKKMAHYNKLTPRQQLSQALLKIKDLEDTVRNFQETKVKKTETSPTSEKQSEINKLNQELDVVQVEKEKLINNTARDTYLVERTKQRVMTENLKLKQQNIELRKICQQKASANLSNKKLKVQQQLAAKFLNEVKIQKNEFENKLKEAEAAHDKAMMKNAMLQKKLQSVQQKLDEYYRREEKEVQLTQMGIIKSKPLFIIDTNTLYHYWFVFQWLTKSKSAVRIPHIVYLEIDKHLHGNLRILAKNTLTQVFEIIDKAEDTKFQRWNNNIKHFAKDKLSNDGKILEYMREMSSIYKNIILVSNDESFCKRVIKEKFKAIDPNLGVGFIKQELKDIFQDT